MPNHRASPEVVFRWKADVTERLEHLKTLDVLQRIAVLRHIPNQLTYIYHGNNASRKLLARVEGIPSGEKLLQLAAENRLEESARLGLYVLRPKKLYLGCWKITEVRAGRWPGDARELLDKYAGATFTCPICHRFVVTVESRAIDMRFCSRECREAAQTGFPDPFDYKSIQEYFCSLAFKDALSTRRLTEAELCRQAGIDVTLICTWQSGRHRSPWKTTLDKLAVAMEVNPLALRRLRDTAAMREAGRQRIGRLDEWLRKHAPPGTDLPTVKRQQMEKARKHRGESRNRARLDGRGSHRRATRSWHHTEATRVRMQASGRISRVLQRATMAGDEQAKQRVRQKWEEFRETWSVVFRSGSTALRQWMEKSLISELRNALAPNRRGRPPQLAANIDRAIEAATSAKAGMTSRVVAKHLKLKTKRDAYGNDIGGTKTRELINIGKELRRLRVPVPSTGPATQSTPAP